MKSLPGMFGFDLSGAHKGTPRRASTPARVARRKRNKRAHRSMLLNAWRRRSK